MDIINFNGKLQSKGDSRLSLHHSFFMTGRVITEKLRLYNGQLLFSEFHYFHLMASMRMARMFIPMVYTPENFEKQIMRLIEEKELLNAYITFHVLENKGKVLFYIDAEQLSTSYLFKEKDFLFDLYRESYVSNTFYDRIPFLTPINSILEVYAQENGYDDLLLQNTEKKLARTLKGNIFLIKDTTLSTPSLEAGAYDHVLRNRVLDIAKKAPEFNIVTEEEIYPFSITKADEIFIAAEGKGIISIGKYKKNQYSSDYTEAIVEQILGLV